jgi:3-hydroxyisobutyrate dehydrogenase-like beta-hydroxyacid dehydrogenase
VAAVIGSAGLGRMGRPPAANLASKRFDLAGVTKPMLKKP